MQAGTDKMMLLVCFEVQSCMLAGHCSNGATQVYPLSCLCLLSSCGYRLRAMVAEKIFDSPEARYNYARFPRASKNFSSGMWLPIKSASMPKCDPMHRICQSTHHLRARAPMRSGHQQPDNRTRLKWHRFDPLRSRLCLVLRTCRCHCIATALAFRESPHQLGLHSSARSP